METILLLLIFILIPLANYVLERMRRRYEASPPESRRAPDPGMRRQPAPPPPTPSAGDRKRAPEARPVVVIQSTARPGIRRTLFRTRRDVRRTIVGMTILGPCRAYDPPDY